MNNYSSYVDKINKGELFWYLILSNYICSITPDSHRGTNIVDNIFNSLTEKGYISNTSYKAYHTCNVKNIKELLDKEIAIYIMQNT